MTDFTLRLSSMFLLLCKHVPLKHACITDAVVINWVSLECQNKRPGYAVWCIIKKRFNTWSIFRGGERGVSNLLLRTNNCYCFNLQTKIFLLFSYPLPTYSVALTVWVVNQRQIGRYSAILLGVITKVEEGSRSLGPGDGTWDI